jgi:hypothetical protein
LDKRLLCRRRYVEGLRCRRRERRLRDDFWLRRRCGLEHRRFIETDYRHSFDLNYRHNFRLDHNLSLDYGCSFRLKRYGHNLRLGCDLNYRFR